MATRKTKPTVVPEEPVIETPTTVSSTAKSVAVPYSVERIARVLIIGLLFLLPLFFLPASIAVVQSAKMFLVYAVSIAVSVMTLVPLLRQKSISLPSNSIVVTSILLVLVYVIAGIFSQNPTISFFGRDFGPDSVVAVLAFFGLAVATLRLYKDRLYAMYAYTALCVTAAIVLVIHGVNLFVHAGIVHGLIPATILSWMGLFSTPIANTIGKWNELGIFALLALMVAWLGLQYLKLAKPARVFLYVLCVLSTIFVVVVNFTLVWWVLGVFSLGMGVKALFAQTKKRTVAFVVPVVLFVLSVAFLAFGTPLGGLVTPVFGIQHLEVRPSFEATATIAQGALSGWRTVIGSGPALFENEWQQFRPLSVLPTNFWNIDFRFGFGLLPTFLVTTGLLGALTWILFFVALIVLTIKALRYKTADVQERFLLAAGSVSMWFSWIVLLFYLPNTTLIAYAAMFTGLFIATTSKLGILTTKLFVAKNVVLQRVLYGALVLLMVVIALLGIKMLLKSVAHVFFQQSVATLTRTGDITQAEPLVIRAAKIDPIDIYFRSIAEVSIAKLQSLVAADAAGETVDPALFQRIANTAVREYEKAIAYDPESHVNYMNLANLYTNLATIGATTVYDVAKANYSAALDRKPDNPATFLALAQLEFVNGDVPAARAAIDKATELKGNYAEAYLFLTQIELAQGSTERAIEVLKRAGANNPNDPFVYFQLGLLLYDAGNTEEAVLAFERAVSLNPNFQNAKYFLGLSYYAVGQVDSAIRQFEALVQLNPENADVATILERLRRGEAPIVEQAPLETLEELPLEEGEDEAAGEVEAVE